MKVLLSGYYGFRNIGDDAVCQAIIKGLKERHGDEIKTFSRRSLRELWDCDLFISGGGTLFQNATSPLSFYYYIGLVLLAKILGKKVMILGQGFGPLKGWFARAVARAILNRMDIITLRDQASYNELKELGINRPRIEVTADPTLILPKGSDEKGKRILSLEGVPKEKLLIGIAARNLVKKDSQRLFKNIARTLDWFTKTYNYHPVFIILQSPPDLEAASDILHEMHEKYSLVFRFCRPEEMLALVSQFDLLIGMRLHSLIFALINQVPMLGISYDPKVTAFMDEIGQACLSIGQAEDYDTLKNEIEKVYRNKEAIKKDLELKRKELSAKAAHNFDRLW